MTRSSGKIAPDELTEPPEVYSDFGPELAGSSRSDDSSSRKHQELPAARLAHGSGERSLAM
jgi:hypothetical protein